MRTLKVLRVVDRVLTGLLGFLARVEAGMERVRQDALRRAAR